VLTTGTIGAGDDITVGQRPDHDVTIGCLAIGPDRAQMQRLLDSGVPLARGVRAKARRALERGR
jgi:MOSC domain-containing protein YiiM